MKGKKYIDKKNNNANRGITLIALVITIIVLLILAGISIATLTGENGILKKANTAKEQTEEATAKEKLQVELMALTVDKQHSKDYNKDEYLNNKLEEKGFIIEENDIVIVDDYYFKIDRDKLEIIESMGKSKNNVLLSYSVYDNQDSTNLKARLKFYSENGIKSIEKPDGTVINGEGMKEVYMDHIANLNVSEKFKVVLKDGSKLEVNLKITENGINEAFKIGKYEIEDNIEENQFANITIDYDNKENTDKTYYKIGESGKWYSYTDSIQLDMAAIENVTDLAGNEGYITIYIKKEDINGNIVTITKKVHINSTAYNVFSNIRYKGESSNKYFTSTSDANEFISDFIGDNYLIHDFGYGHWSGSGVYTATYNLDYDKLELKTANKLKVSFANHIYNNSDIINSFLKIYYKDGSTSEEKAAEVEFNEKWSILEGTENRSSVILDLDENKTIDYIEIKISGYDSKGGEFYGVIRDVVFYGVTK